VPADVIRPEHDLARSPRAGRRGRESRWLPARAVPRGQRRLHAPARRAADAPCPDVDPEPGDL